MKRTITVVLGGLVLASVSTGVGFVSAQADDSSSTTAQGQVTKLDASVDSISSVQSKTPALPEKLELMAAMTTQAFEFPMQIAKEGEEPLSLSREDFVRQRRAILAQMAGLEFEPSELLAPLYDADGNLAAYQAMNVKGYVSVEEAQAPGFDSCARQAADTGKPARGCE